MEKIADFHGVKQFMRQAPLNRKIGFRLIMVVSVTSMVTIGIFTYFNTASNTQGLLSEVERHANQLSEAVKASIEYDMRLNHREGIQNALERIVDRKSVQHVRVINKTGAVIYSSDKSEIGGIVDKKAKSCYRCHSTDRTLDRLNMEGRAYVFHPQPGGPRILGIANPIYNAPTCWTAACHAHPKSQVVLGILDITIPLTEIDKSIRHAQMLIAILAVGSIFLLSLIVGLFVKRWIDVPIQELLEATQHIADSDFNFTIKENRNDEMGLLAKSFNNMTRMLDMKIKELAEANARTEDYSKTLESKVEVKVNELKEVQSRFFQSEKMSAIGQLAAGIAHEMNNPLGIILGFAQSVATKIKETDPLSMPLKSIAREAMRCKDLVQNLLTFSRAQKNERQDAIDLNATLESALALIEAQTKTRNVELVKKLDTNLPKIHANKVQLQQVLINLANNAMDAMPTGGTLTIRTLLSEKHPGCVEIQVQDTGQGIPNGIQAKIFEPFFTTKEVGKGTGLGLALVHEIVQKHQGTIELTSEEGKGTTFTVSLPIQTPKI